MKKEKSSNIWLKILVHLGGMLPLLIIGVNALRGNLGFNPVQTILKHTGRSAVIFLLLSLACTPLHNLLVLPVVQRLRKPLGLYSSLYALIHFSVFAIWDYRLNFALIWSEISNKPFILLGFGATIILLLLAATSFRFWQKKLGVWWSRLHKLVYLAGILIILHFLLAIKGDLFSLQGGYRAPLIAAGTLVVLFLLRIPFIYTPIRRILGREPAARNHP